MLRNPDRILSERRSNAVGTLIGSRRNTHHTQSGLNYADFMGALARKMPARKYYYDQIVDRYQAMILNDDSLVEFLAGITIHDAKEFLGSFKW